MTVVCRLCGREGHVVGQHCDECGAVVMSKAVLDYYGDVLQMDWVLCTRCKPLRPAGKGRPAV